MLAMIIQALVWLQGFFVSFVRYSHRSPFHLQHLCNHKRRCRFCLRWHMNHRRTQIVQTGILDKFQRSIPLTIDSFGLIHQQSRGLSHLWAVGRRAWHRIRPTCRVSPPSFEGQRRWRTTCSSSACHYSLEMTSWMSPRIPCMSSLGIRKETHTAVAFLRTLVCPENIFHINRLIDKVKLFQKTWGE